MPLKIYNTLAKDYQVFEPLKPPNVNMYVCGITPYDETILDMAALMSFLTSSTGI